MMHYPKELFDLNFAFVYKASEILERPWPDLLLEYTHTFRRFRLGAQLDPHNPIWLQYLDSVRQSHDPAGYSYHFYLERERVMGPKKLEPAFGCFSYQLQPQEGGLICGSILRTRAWKVAGHCAASASPRGWPS